MLGFFQVLPLLKKNQVTSANCLFLLSIQPGNFVPAISTNCPIRLLDLNLLYRPSHRAILLCHALRRLYGTLVVDITDELSYSVAAFKHSLVISFYRKSFLW
jgi:hypothetical protein